MDTEPAILRGAECPASESETFAELIARSVQSHPLRSVVQIDASEQARSLSASRIWRLARSLLAALPHPASGPRPPLILCLDSFHDLIAAGWAAAASDRDCHFWHLIDGHDASCDLAGRWCGLQGMLGPCQLVTRSRVLSRFRVDWKSEAWPPVCLDRLPEADPGGTVSLGTSRHRGSILVKTSGTTGTGELSVLPYSVQLARLRSNRTTQRGLVKLSALPMDNITGLSCLFMEDNLHVLLDPAAVAIDPLSLFRAIERFGVQEFSVSTSSARRFAETLRRSRETFDLRSVCCLSAGFEPIDPGAIAILGEELVRRGAEDLRVTLGYGLTEVGRVAFTPDLDLASLRSRAGAAGGPVPLAVCAAGREVRIGDESGAALPEGSEGEIQIFAPQRTIAGYLEEKGGLLPVRQVDGWVCSGDVGRLDSRGLVIVGRSKGIIFFNGKCISLEPVEASLLEAGIVRDGLVAAAPLEGTGRPDDYAVMFCPAGGGDEQGLIARARQIATASIGIRPARTVAWSADRFLFTGTGKMRKRHMARLCAVGDAAETPAAAATPSAGTDRVPAPLREIWCSVLNIDRDHMPEGSFFELGGTSMGAVEFLHRVEAAFGMRVQAERFFAEPTLVAVSRLLLGDDREGRHDRPPEAGVVLRRVQARVRPWTGWQLSSRGLFRGLNVTGKRPPIFWFFQSEQEFVRLAAALGDDQPLFGMPSLHNIIPIPQLSETVLREVANGCAAELLVIARSRPFVLGGNCQGSIVALHLAQTLDQLGCAPSTLVLMEWTFAWGCYGRPVVLLCGNRSRTAQAFSSPDACGLPWTHDFPSATVRWIQGAHGEFFEPENIASLAGRLLALTVP